VKEYLSLFIWVVVIGVAFAILLRKGYLLQLSNYVAETREELRKCTWPSRNELWGSTVVVVISIVFLGVFTLVIDFVVSRFVISFLFRLVT
jgi:preprotein translocase SecE subunit